MSLPPHVRSPHQAGLCSGLLLAVAALVAFVPAGTNPRLLTLAIGAVAVVAAVASAVLQPRPAAPWPASTAPHTVAALADHHTVVGSPSPAARPHRHRVKL